MPEPGRGLTGVPVNVGGVWSSVVTCTAHCEVQYSHALASRRNLPDGQVHCSHVGLLDLIGSEKCEGLPTLALINPRALLGFTGATKDGEGEGVGACRGLRGFLANLSSTEVLKHGFPLFRRYGSALMHEVGPGSPSHLGRNTRRSRSNWHKEAVTLASKDLCRHLAHLGTCKAAKAHNSDRARRTCPPWLPQPWRNTSWRCVKQTSVLVRKLRKRRGQMASGREKLIGAGTTVAVTFSMRVMSMSKSWTKPDRYE